MLEEFWNQKKHLIQLLGILIGVGAIFLNIPTPDNQNALVALRNVQLAWLIIITISQAFLFWQLFSLTIRIEKRTKEKMHLSTDAISTFFFGLAIWILWNLWSYMLSIYNTNLVSFLHSGFIGAAVSALILTVSIFVISRIKLEKHWEILAIFVITAPVLGLWSEGQKLSFQIFGWLLATLYWYIVQSIAVTSAILVVLYKRNKKQKLQ